MICQERLRFIDLRLKSQDSLCLKWCVGELDGGETRDAKQIGKNSPWEMENPELNTSENFSWTW